jgi:hypothetical protein
VQSSSSVHAVNIASLRSISSATDGRLQMSVQMPWRVHLQGNSACSQCAAMMSVRESQQDDAQLQLGWAAVCVQVAVAGSSSLCCTHLVSRPVDESQSQSAVVVLKSHLLLASVQSASVVQTLSTPASVLTTGGATMPLAVHKSTGCLTHPSSGSDATAGSSTRQLEVQAFRAWQMAPGRPASTLPPGRLIFATKSRHACLF